MKFALEKIPPAQQKVPCQGLGSGGSCLGTVGGRNPANQLIW